jgi:hypothetical protein
MSACVSDCYCVNVYLRAVLGTVGCHRHAMSGEQFTNSIRRVTCFEKIYVEIINYNSPSIASNR